MSSQPPTKDELQRQVDEVKQDADVQRALKQATPAEKTEAPVRGRDKFVIGTHLVLLIVLGVLYQVLRSQFPSFVGKYPLTLKLILAIAVVIVCLMVLRLVDVYFIGRVQNAPLNLDWNLSIKRVSNCASLFCASCASLWLKREG